MKYSEDLISKVKELFPDQAIMQKLAIEGSPFLGQYLHGTWGISLDQILTAMSLQDIQDKARHEKRKQLLFNQWHDEKENQA